MFWQKDTNMEFLRAVDTGDENNIKVLLSSEAVNINAVSNMDSVIYTYYRAFTSFEFSSEIACTPLSKACAKGFLNIFDILMSYGADITVRDADGKTPLHRAVTHEQHDIIVALLKAGADINGRICQNVDHVFEGFTPLLLACHNDWHSTITLLINAGADVNRGVTTMEYDRIKRSYATISYASPLHYTLRTAATCSRTPSLLIEHGADVHIVNQDGHCPLYLALMKNYQDVASQLITAGARKDHLLKGQLGYNLLKRASSIPDYTTALSYLVNTIGIDINAVDEHGQSVLMFVCTLSYETTIQFEERRVDVVRYLLTLDMDVLLKDERFRTAVHIANEHLGSGSRFAVIKQIIETREISARATASITVNRTQLSSSVLTMLDKYKISQYEKLSTENATLRKELQRTKKLLHKLSMFNDMLMTENEQLKGENNNSSNDNSTMEVKNNADGSDVK